MTSQSFYCYTINIMKPSDTCRKVVLLSTFSIFDISVNRGLFRTISVDFEILKLRNDIWYMVQIFRSVQSYDFDGGLLMKGWVPETSVCSNFLPDL